MREMELSVPARSDVKSLWRTIASDNLVAANRILDRIDATFQHLRESPHVGSDMSQYGIGLRAFSVGNYVVSFINDDRRVTIVRVIHGARDFPDVFRGRNS